MLWLGFPIWILAGVVTMIAYRWNEVDCVDGKELLLDILLFPFIIYYWAKHKRSGT